MMGMMVTLDYKLVDFRITIDTNLRTCVREFLIGLIEVGKPRLM